jgi:PTS system mannose-specific IID component
LIPFLILWAIRFPLFKFGYSRSVSIIQDISGNTSFARLQEAAQIVGLMVVGGFVPSMVGIGLTLTYTKEINGNIREVRLQDTLDGILPYLLPICVVAFCYWMIKQKKMKPTSAILVLAIIAFVLGSLGIIG